ncbi:MAG TPA: carbonic anhydrase [Candidatus Binataceae bacterium]|nr:carbonic anhydrase [Candidatus Binataceae bacterium]
MSIRTIASPLAREIVLCCLLVLIAASVLLVRGIAAAAEVTPTIPPAQELQQLLDGNQRYVKGNVERPGQRPSDAPQRPLAVVLACADSRVAPEIIFDQGIGDLFVVRVAGNTYDRLALESIEYGVLQLGTSIILVVGHDRCGAVTAAVKAYPDPHAGPMLTNIYPAVREARTRPGDEVANAIDDNAVLIADRLAKDPKLAARIKSGQLKVLPAHYYLKTGEVKLLP